MCFCFVLVVHRVPVFFYIFYIKIEERKIKFWFLYQKLGSLRLQGIKFISIYSPLTMGGQPYIRYARCW